LAAAPMRQSRAVVILSKQNGKSRTGLPIARASIVSLEACAHAAESALRELKKSRGAPGAPIRRMSFMRKYNDVRGGKWYLGRTLERLSNWCRGRVRSRRDAVQGAPRRSGWAPAQAAQRRNAPFWIEPFGQPREPVACGVRGDAESSLP
jgi:hypothetical protein